MSVFTKQQALATFINLTGGAKRMIKMARLIGPTGATSSTVGVKGAPFARLMPYLQKCTQITTAGAGTYTTEQILGGLIDRDTNGAPRTDTLPTAALLVAAIPGVEVNHELTVRVYNSSGAANAITIAAGTGGTLIGTATVNQTTVATFLIHFTNVTSGSEAYNLYRL